MSTHEVSLLGPDEPAALSTRRSDAWKRVPPDGSGDLRRVVGLSAIGFSATYLLSDLIEIIQGNFSTVRLSLTYAGEAAIPLFVLGIYALQRQRMGRLGLIGAIIYAYSYVFFTCTVMYALIAHTKTYHDVSTVFGAWMTIHGLLMVVGGLAFGLAILRAEIMPRWTGPCLMIGVIAVAAASGLPNVARALAEALPAAAFIGMGITLVRSDVPPK